MENDKLDNDLLDSRLITIRDILDMGGYIPSLVLEKMNEKYDIPVSDFIRTDDPKKNVFGYVMENMETIFQTTDGGTINTSVPAPIQESYAQAQLFDNEGDYCVRFSKSLHNNEFTEWEEYQSKAGLIARLMQVNNSNRMRLAWLSESEHPFEYEWYDLNPNFGDDSDSTDDYYTTTRSDFA